ncbi:MAG TPA: tetratricopeptide repeat protein [Pirellulales bacterium]|nr:tetratricopeptide repeat protein [Pirellulales bacterium]
MKFRMLLPLVIGLGCLLAADCVWAQRIGRDPNGDGNQNQQGRDPNQNGGAQNPDGQNAAGENAPAADAPKKEEEEVKPPDDPRLLDLHRQFVLSAEKLGDEYERTNQFDKARICYEEVVRLTPFYPKGKEHLARAKEKQATAERKLVHVMANEDWQDSGVVVAAGKPIIITATGFWDFRMSVEVTPDGMEIPKEWRDFSLGSLVGMVDDGNPKDGKPFFIGAHTEVTPKRTGRLLLRMYDSDLADNTGKLQVSVTGSFVTGGKKQSSASSSSASN